MTSDTKRRVSSGVLGGFVLADSVLIAVLMHFRLACGVPDMGPLLCIAILIVFVAGGILIRRHLYLDLDLDPHAVGMAVFALTFLIAIGLATPKVYKCERRYEHQPTTRTILTPAWITPDAVRPGDVFVGLSYSVVLTEALSSAALGLLAWAVTNVRKKKMKDAH